MRCKRVGCNEDHVTRHGLPACVAHKKSTGAPCQASPVHGATVCSKHGAQAGPVKRKAAERVVRDKIERTMGDLREQHARPDEHPFAWLLDHSRELAATTRALSAMVDEYRSDGDDERLHVVLGLYREIGRLSAQVSKLVLDANLDERMTQISERTGERLFVALRKAERAADLSLEQQDALRAALAEALLGDLTPEQREQWQAEAWERHQRPYRVQAPAVEA